MYAQILASDSGKHMAWLVSGGLEMGSLPGVKVREVCISSVWSRVSE